MAAMVSIVLSSLVCVLYVILLPAVWADYCSSYWDSEGFYHDVQQCGPQHCCGHCYKKYCCGGDENHLTQEKQEDCPGRPTNFKQIKTAVVLVGVLVPLFLTILCVVPVVCCVSPCCLLYKKCRKGRNRRQQVVINTHSVVTAHQQLVYPSGYQPSYPGYQLVSVLHGYGGPPVPTAPPLPYLEANNAANSPVPFPPGQPMNPHQPVWPNEPSLHSDELAQPPYNPSYGPNP